MDEEIVCLVCEEEVKHLKSAETIYKVTGHKNELNLAHDYLQVGKVYENVRKDIKISTGSCKICKKYKRSQGTPKVSLMKVMDLTRL